VLVVISLLKKKGAIMKTYITFLLYFFLLLCPKAFCGNIFIEPIEPVPGFQNIGGPAFGESMPFDTGKGLVQLVTSTRIMINSNLYYIDQTSGCEQQIQIQNIQPASVVSFELNQRSQVKKLTLITQLDQTGMLDRIDDKSVVCDDQYRKLYTWTTYHDVSGNLISKSNFVKGNYIGMTLNKDGAANSLWQLNGYYVY